jgi:hypothetical protein
MLLLLPISLKKLAGTAISEGGSSNATVPSGAVSDDLQQRNTQEGST